ncbi:MAG: transposase/IS protein [Pelotomaculum sp. PtaB.Bin104]|nr:MAG: transposase/IS protein [Pelotomaculum sp. PtaB.Bin104]
MAASRNFYTVKYVRLPDLLSELAVARGDGSYRKVMKQYKQVKLLILDEWLLFPLKESEARDLLEIVEVRHKRASTIFCSQFDVAGWHLKIGEPTLADAICDRIVHDSYTIMIEGDSMRKKKGINR